MSLPEDGSKQNALRREWAAARIVVIGGLIVAVAVAGYFVWRQQQESRAELQASMPHAVTPTKVDPKLLARAELAVCTAELLRAVDIGIVPSYGRLASPGLVRGNAPSRFICEAKTNSARYFISADVRCNNLKDARCISIYRIALKDGTLIYDRPE